MKLTRKTILPSTKKWMETACLICLDENTPSTLKQPQEG